MKKLKQQKGITLIALIITIIVLLILATVSIKLLVDQGIVGRSQNATSKYVIEEEKEKINLAYADYKMAKVEDGNATLTIPNATVSGDETSGWTITFDKTGNGYTLTSEGKVEPALSAEEQLDLLNRYFLGKNENGESKTFMDVIHMEGSEGFEFICNDIIPDASTKITCIAEEEDESNGYFYLRYGNRVYRLQCDKNTMENKEIELVIEVQGRVGQKIKYSYDGTVENEKEWTILYDYGDTVEIISPDTMGNLKLGWDDEDAQNPGDVDKDRVANTQVDKAIYSYNNAVSRLNGYCTSLITNPNKIQVRSAGSNYQDPNAEGGMYKSDYLSSVYEGRYNGIARDQDNNYEQDFFRMAYCNMSDKYNEDFWCASREIHLDEDNNISHFYCVRYFAEWGSVNRGYYGIWRIGENFGGADATTWTSNTYPVCPIVKISSDSIKK